MVGLEKIQIENITPQRELQNTDPNGAQLAPDEGFYQFDQQANALVQVWIHAIELLLRCENM